MSTVHTNYRQVALTSGQANAVRLAVPVRGFLRRLTIKQASGTADGFSVDVYDRQDSCPPNTPSAERDADSGDPVTLDVEVHKLVATQTVTGPATALGLFDQELAYANRDDTTSNNIGTAAIYLSITPSGAGAKTFDIGWTAEAETSG